MPKTLILGGGPAGLTAAYEFMKKDKTRDLTVFEADSIVGGISRTENYKGYRFDIGGHRFFTKVSQVDEMWKEVMGDDFITVTRLSRIYYRGRFFDYPLKIFNALSQIGFYESTRISLSYAKWKLRPSKREDTFEQWVINRFGGRLYMHFFRSYTKKVWGIPPDQIRADWAAQRIKDLSLPKAVWKALTGAGNSTSLIEEFRYPRLGPGMMWETVAALLEDQGATVQMQTHVTKVRREGNTIKDVEVTHYPEDGAPVTRTVTGDDFVSSIAIRDLIEIMDPPPPTEVRDAADRLKYRDFLIVPLILNEPSPFPDNWIYIHEPSVKVGRIQNFRAWSPEMLPDDYTASIGMEYFCQKGDGLWSMSDADLIDLAGTELEQLSLSTKAAVIDGTVIRQPKAYPVYDAEYKDALDIIEAWMKSFANLQTCGRNGLHRYNNQDHSMLSAMLAARNLMGEDHDIWNLNVERSYHEEFEVDKPKMAS